MNRVRQFVQSDLEALHLSADELVDAMTAAFAALRDGRLLVKPKASILPPDGAFFMSSFGVWKETGLAVFHTVIGTAAKDLPPGAPHYATCQIVSDYRSAVPLALIDAAYVSTMLPAGITALTARHLARPDSRIATFVAAGGQAIANLDVLRARFPLREIRILSRTSASADAFATHVRGLDLDARVFMDSRAAVEGADIVVSSVPSGSANKPFLDPAWVSPGAYVSAVDVGRSWLPGFETFERRVTDDRDQAVAQYRDGRMAYGGGFDTEIPELVAGVRPGREKASDRVVVIHPGCITGVVGMVRLFMDRLGIRPR